MGGLFFTVYFLLFICVSFHPLNVILTLILGEDPFVIFVVVLMMMMLFQAILIIIFAVVHEINSMFQILYERRLM